MVFKKPYAFLIKHFRKIHIALLLTWIYLYLKVSDIARFVRDFITLGSYSNTLESFSSKVGVLFYIAVIFIVISSIFLMLLLKRKGKPWKVYLIYIAEYFFLLITIIMLSNFFSSYSLKTAASGVLIYRDMLNICNYLQYLILVFLIIRILGLDRKSLNFKNDEEYLELSSEDKEEFEISFDFDRNSIKRTLNRLKRNVTYFYKEHKFICDILLTIFLVTSIGYTYYYFGIVHRSYKQGDTFTAGIYNINIEDAYITNKDLAGNSIEKGYNFVIVSLKIKNNSQKEVQPNLNRFHLMNKNTEKSHSIYYNTYFKDLGTGADSKTTIGSGKEKTLYIVYKVKNDLNKDRFVLYYQELGGKLRSYLRKIKLNIKDVSEIKDIGEYNLNDTITFEYIRGEQKKIEITESAIGKNAIYNRYYCPSDTVCGVYEQNLEAKPQKSILKLSFASSDFEGEEFIDFSSSYGKIKYIDNNGKIGYKEIKNAIDTNYQGKEIFISTDEEVLNAEKIWIEYTLRNKKYTLKIK